MPLLFRTLYFFPSPAASRIIYSRRTLPRLMHFIVFWANHTPHAFSSSLSFSGTNLLRHFSRSLWRASRIVLTVHTFQKQSFYCKRVSARCRADDESRTRPVETLILLPSLCLSLSRHRTTFLDPVYPEDSLGLLYSGSPRANTTAPQQRRQSTRDVHAGSYFSLRLIYDNFNDSRFTRWIPRRKKHTRER